MRKNTISLKVNNKELLNIMQNEIGGDVKVKILNPKNHYKDFCNISAGDMVMLMNFYKYIKDSDIQNDFINPNGKNHE